MSTDLMIDEARKRFESQDFPDTITPFYIGHMTNLCSLGRVVMGYSAPNLPIKRTSLDVSAVLLKYVLPDEDEDVLDAVVGHIYENKYELSENISAIRFNYLFFDPFGNKISEHFYSLMMDIPKGEWQHNDVLYYDNYYTQRVLKRGKSIDIMPSLSAKNYNLCLFGISAVRTTDGVLYEQDTDDFLAMTEWVMPRK